MTPACRTCGRTLADGAALYDTEHHGTDSPYSEWYECRACIEAGDDSYDDPCHQCGGDGVVLGEDMEDPEEAGPMRCPCCGGSGDAKDCVYW